MLGPTRAEPPEFQLGSVFSSSPFHIHGAEAPHLQVLQKAAEKGILEEVPAGRGAGAGAQLTLSSLPLLRLRTLNGKGEINQGEQSGSGKAPVHLGLLQVTPPGWGGMEGHPRLLLTAELLGEGGSSAGSEGRVRPELSPLQRQHNLRETLLPPPQELQPEPKA